VKNDLLEFSGITEIFNGQNNMPLLQYRLKKYILPQKFYQRNPETVARELIGALLIYLRSDGCIIAGQIMETEAYLSVGDAASPSAKGRNKRNRSMFADGGALYVYQNLLWCALLYKCSY